MERDTARDLFWSHAQFAVPRKAIPRVAESVFQIIRLVPKRTITTHVANANRDNWRGRNKRGAAANCAGLIRDREQTRVPRVARDDIKMRNRTTGGEGGNRIEFKL